MCRHPSTCPTGTCRKGERAWRPSKSDEVKGEEAGWGKKKVDDEEEEKMKGKRGAKGDMQDSLVVKESMIVKFPLVPVATFSAAASRFFPAKRS